MMFTGHAFEAFSQASKIVWSLDFKVKNPFFSLACNKTDFPSFFGHLKLVWSHFHTIIATNALIPL